MVYTQSRIHCRKWDASNSLGLWDTNRQPNADQKLTRTCHLVDFVVPADDKMKENKKRDKYLDLTRQQQKKLWDMKVTVVPIVVDALGMVP